MKFNVGDYVYGDTIVSPYEDGKRIVGRIAFILNDHYFIKLDNDYCIWKKSAIKLLTLDIYLIKGEI